jgi:hypothetical protein
MLWTGKWRWWWNAQQWGHHWFHWNTNWGESIIVINWWNGFGMEECIWKTVSLQHFLGAGMNISNLKNHGKINLYHILFELKKSHFLLTIFSCAQLFPLSIKAH